MDCKVEVMPESGEVWSIVHDGVADHREALVWSLVAQAAEVGGGTEDERRRWLDRAIEQLCEARDREGVLSDVASPAAWTKKGA